MANRADHLKTGVISSAAVTGLISLMKARQEGRPINWRDVVRDTLLGGIGGVVGGLLPDILEPPRHPGHRDLFHSRLALIGMPIVGAKLMDSANLSQSAVTVGEGFSVGYISHLILDSRTPRGLP